MDVVKVVVPKSGKRHIRTMGVFVTGKGILPVDIPYGLQFGDEFELSFKKAEAVALKVTKVPLPYGVEPGTVFKHRAPNGKNVTISCPPNVSAGCNLLVPWSDSTNEHFVVQAQIAPDEESNNTLAKKPTAQQPNRNNRNNNNNRMNSNFVDDDFRLAQMLSLTTLQSTRTLEEQEMERVMKASLEEFKRAPPPEELMIEQVMKSTQAQKTPEDLELEEALKASLQDYHKPTQAWLETATENFTHEKHGATTKNAQNDFDPMDDDEETMLKRIVELSLKEAQENAALTMASQQNKEPSSFTPDRLSRKHSSFSAESHGSDDDDDHVKAEPHVVVKIDEERNDFLSSLPEDVRRQVLRQRAIQEQLMMAGIDH